MTKNRSMRIAVLVLALALITCCFVGTTFAKYTSSATGTASSATVAKWSFVDATTGELAKTGNTATVTFDLFGTITETDGSTETDVADDKIAPGTKGSAAFDITNASEVNAEYSVTFTAVNASNVPVVITYNAVEYTINGEGKIVDESDNELEVSGEVAMGDKITDALSWVWVFDTTDPVGQNDTSDTALGILAQQPGTVPTVSVTASITFTQVD